MKKRLLIIDNDKSLNRINEKILHSSGLVSEVHIALHGREALDYLIARDDNDHPQPHVIILELNMPVMSGFQFIDEFNRLDIPGKSKIELVVFTSSSNPKDREKAVSKGIRHYLNKPYLLRGLRGIIDRVTRMC